MSHRTAISRYIQIIDLVKNRNYTGAKLISKIYENDNVGSPSTLKRDLNALRNEFGFEIKYNKSTNFYYLDVEQSTSLETLTKIFELIGTREIIEESIKANKENLQYLSFGSSSSMEGISNLWLILKAIQDCQVIEIVHESFSNNIEKIYIIEPLGLKEYDNRWYVVGKVQDSQQNRTFGLDRIKQISVKPTKFIRNKNENVLDEFENIIGLVYSVHSLQKVILSFSPSQGKYIKTLKIHHSQVTIIDDSAEFRIELRIKPNLELIQKIMGYGNEVKVLEPFWLVQEIKEKLQRTIKMYE